jgi:hypothetical protein
MLLTLGVAFLDAVNPFVCVVSVAFLDAINPFVCVGGCGIFRCC